MLFKKSYVCQNNTILNLKLSKSKGHYLINFKLTSMFTSNNVRSTYVFIKKELFLILWKNNNIKRQTTNKKQ